MDNWIERLNTVFVGRPIARLIERGVHVKKYAGQ